jgi:hypothetical protein
MRLRRPSHVAEVEDLGPLVWDVQGLPVGVHVDDTVPMDDSAQARRLRRLEGLRRTRELDAQHRLRLGVSLFSSDPPH